MYNTNVWWDPWLRVSNSPYIATPVIEGLENLTLSSLVNITKLQWSFSRDECYSVKSAYFHIMENVIDNSHLRENGDWMLLWKLKMPQRIIKIFLGRKEVWYISLYSGQQWQLPNPYDFITHGS